MERPVASGGATNFEARWCTWADEEAGEAKEWLSGITEATVCGRLMGVDRT